MFYNQEKKINKLRQNKARLYLLINLSICSLILYIYETKQFCGSFVCFKLSWLIIPVISGVLLLNSVIFFYLNNFNRNKNYFVFIIFYFISLTISLILGATFFYYILRFTETKEFDREILKKELEIEKHKKIIEENRDKFKITYFQEDNLRDKNGKIKYLFASFTILNQTKNSDEFKINVSVKEKNKSFHASVLEDYDVFLNSNESKTVNIKIPVTEYSAESNFEEGPFFVTISIFTKNGLFKFSGDPKEELKNNNSLDLDISVYTDKKLKTRVYKPSDFN